jgi:hypothetical protein
MFWIEAWLFSLSQNIKYSTSGPIQRSAFGNVARQDSLCVEKRKQENYRSACGVPESHAQDEPERSPWLSLFAKRRLSKIVAKLQEEDTPLPLVPVAASDYNRTLEERGGLET